MPLRPFTFISLPRVSDSSTLLDIELAETLKATPKQPVTTTRLKNPNKLRYFKGCHTESSLLLTQVRLWVCLVWVRVGIWVTVALLFLFGK